MGIPAGVLGYISYQIKQHFLFLKTQRCVLANGNSTKMNVNFYSVISVHSNTSMLN